MSKSDRQLDHIIIGQGIAGSLLAYRLIEAGQNIIVIDNEHHGSSSKVAAGIINPITGYRLTTNRLFAKQQTIAYALYEELESLFGRELLVHLDQYRLLKSEEQVAFWNRRVKHETYMLFTGETTQQRAPFVNNEFGVVEIKRAGRVYVSELLECFKQWLLEKNSYHCEKINYSNISIVDDKIKINDIEAKNIIFCEGYQAIHNPWWQHLPFKLSKGEILSVKLDKEIDALLNWRQWLLPKHGSRSAEALLGANYLWGDFKNEDALAPTQAARDYLLMRLNTNTTLKAEVIEHRAGIRPTPTHHSPYIGPHQELANVYCFNGFGSKGCVTIPYYSQILVEHILQDKSLPEEVTKWL